MTSFNEKIAEVVKKAIQGSPKPDKLFVMFSNEPKDVVIRTPWLVRKLHWFFFWDKLSQEQLRAFDNDGRMIIVGYESLDPTKYIHQDEHLYLEVLRGIHNATLGVYKPTKIYLTPDSYNSAWPDMAREIFECENIHSPSSSHQKQEKVEVQGLLA